MSGRRRSRPVRILVGSLEAITSFYRRPVAWLALLVSSLLLTFGGGAVMFWFHAIFRGEQGPAIGDLHHWLLDSSLGFFALTPVLALILPLGVRAAGPTGSSGLRAYVLTVAVLFTLTTGPGPFLHDRVAGARTPLARIATQLLGEDAGVAARNMHVHDRSPVAEGLLQVALGLPVYLLCTWLALRLVRALARGSARRPSLGHRRTAPDQARALHPSRPSV